MSRLALFVPLINIVTTQTSQLGPSFRLCSCSPSIEGHTHEDDSHTTINHQLTNGVNQHIRRVTRTATMMNHTTCTCTSTINNNNTGGSVGHSHTNPAVNYGKAKRKRGRPKGSKNRPKLPTAPVVDDIIQLRAPSGVHTGTQDLLQELLPLLAQEELKDGVEETEHEQMVRGRLRQLMADLSSGHRMMSDAQDNLKPFSRVPCDACDGARCVPCDGCDGGGFVEGKGKGSIKVKDVVGDVYFCDVCDGMGKTTCVKCDGAGKIHKDDVDVLLDIDENQDEDKDKDVDQDVDQDQQDVVVKVVDERTQRRRKKNQAVKDNEKEEQLLWNAMDMEGLIRRQCAAEGEGGEDRVEIGKDGLIIVRAKQRKKGAGRKAKVKSEEEIAAEVKKETKAASAVKRKRGRPRKSRVQAEMNEDQQMFITQLAALKNEDLITSGGGLQIQTNATRSDEPTTDFVNTTDYQVGRRLRKMAKDNNNRK